MNIFALVGAHTAEEINANLAAIFHFLQPGFFQDKSIDEFQSLGLDPFDVLLKG